MKVKKILLLLTVWTVFAFANHAATPFTIVLDAGHGGKDPGTLGATCKEKDIVLSVALKVGQLIKNRQPDVKVIYTRSTDQYIELNRRAEIANKNKANLFVSIHADHSDSPNVKGAGTFTLGQNRTAENMSIAKRENAVILLEDNYKQRYEGFDPNSPESYIMFEFMQSTYMDQSIRFASMLQNQFKKDGRIDRGVRQDVFLVLRNTSMPSTLIEIGFLSNKQEEQYLKSESGQNEVAESIYRSFVEFKTEFDRKNNTGNVFVKDETPEPIEETPVEPKISDSDSSKRNVPEKTAPEASSEQDGIVFKVQIMAIDRKLKPTDSLLKGQAADFFTENGFYKYTVGASDSFKEADQLRIALNKKFPGCFVIAFKNGIKTTVTKARAESKQ